MSQILPTPAPWTIEIRGSGGGYMRLRDEDDNLVAELWGCKDVNARVIREAASMEETIREALIDVGAIGRGVNLDAMRDDEAMTISAKSVKALLEAYRKTLEPVA